MLLLDNFLAKVTMYRLLVWVLGCYYLASLIFSLLGLLSTPASALFASLLIILTASFLSDLAFSRISGKIMNSESWLITGLIIFFVLQPATTVTGLLVLALSGLVGSAGKNLLRLRGQHLFNPAALAVAFVSLSGLGLSSWWLGSKWFVILTAIGGFLIVRKMRMGLLIGLFIAATVILQLGIAVATGGNLLGTLTDIILSSPAIFLATIMLTEPATMPSRKNSRYLFALLVAVLYVFAWQLGPFVIYPEVALLLGNVFTLTVSFGRAAQLRLERVDWLSETVAQYTFLPDGPRPRYLAGQYGSLTLPQTGFDERGNRRMLTIASSPQESSIQLAVKFSEPASTFKSRLSKLQVGTSVELSQIRGDFTLDPASAQPLVFIAAGIGITPFRAMVKSLQEKGLHRPASLIYMVHQPSDLVYDDFFRQAHREGTITYYPVVNGGHGILQRSLQESIVYLNQAKIYLCGPDSFVRETKSYLRSIGIKRHSIVTDYFSGF